jgi:hypothetical protein
LPAAAATATFGESGVSRSTRIAQVLLWPLSYDPSTGTIRRIRRLVARVVFGTAPSAGATVPADATETPFIIGLANASIARRWSVPRSVPSVGKRAPRLTAASTAFRLTIASDGVGVVTSDFLSGALSAAGIDPSTVDPATIRLFGWDGSELPETFDASTFNEGREIALQMITAGGRFDRFYFYGHGPWSWKYDSAGRTFKHVLHHYSSTSTYVLTVGDGVGKRLAAAAMPGDPNVFPDSYMEHKFVEEELVNPYTTIAGEHGSGRDLFGRKLYPGASTSYAVPLDGLRRDQPIQYLAVVASSAGVASTMSVAEGGSALGDVPVYASSGYVKFQRSRQRLSASPDAVGSNNMSNLRFAFSTTDAAGIGYVDYFEIAYPCELAARGDQLHLFTPDSTGVYAYSIRGFSAMPTVVDITDPTAATQLTVEAFTNGTATFRVAAGARAPREIVAYVGSSASSPSGIARTTLAGLRAPRAADAIIVTNPATLDAAQRLADYRTAHSGLRVVVATTEQIYDEFSGGMQDPTAIRDFVRYAYGRWSANQKDAPKYLLLFGDGNFDYKNDPTNLVVPYESPDGDSFDEISTLETDSFFGRVNGNDIFEDLAIGRLTPKNPQEAGQIVDRIIDYETKSAEGDWRNLATFVADDNWTSDGDTDGTIHVNQSESLLYLAVPRSFDVRKIYEPSYTLVYSGLNNTGGRTRPGANADLLDAFNSGTLLMNWIGHGNPRVWAHEGIFVRELTIPQIQNRSTLPFIVAATCDFGRFDDPNDVSAAEILTSRPEGGCIGLMAATRSTFSSSNEALAERFYKALLMTRDTLGADRILPTPLGIALYRTHQVTTDPTNDLKFVLLGDPMMRLLVPEYPATIDSVNGVAVSAARPGGGSPTTMRAAGRPLESATSQARLTAPLGQASGAVRGVSGGGIQLRALSKAVLRGKIIHFDSTLFSTFNGTATITVRDADRDLQIQSGAAQFRFSEAGAVLYRGSVTVTNGRFGVTFFVPKDISYANAPGRIGIYARSNDGIDASGFNGDIIIGGTDSSATNDGHGPAIALYMDTRTFRYGDIVSSEPLLITDISDQSGVNSSGAGMGHGLVATVDDSMRIDLTGAYRAAQDDPTSGSAQVRVPGLVSGTHSARVVAWDVFDNSAEANTLFRIVASGQGLTVDSVMNVPNPFGLATIFTFQQNQTSPVDAEVRIYTTAGRLIQTVEQPNNTAHFVKVPWDGRDRDGNRVANGIYLYRLIVHTPDRLESAEVLGKCAVLR